MSCMSCHVNNVFYPAVAASSCQMFKFDTTAAPLEALSAELGVKALPAFRFYRGGKELLPPVSLLAWGAEYRSCWWQQLTGVAPPLACLAALTACLELHALRRLIDC